MCTPPWQCHSVAIRVDIFNIGVIGAARGNCDERLLKYKANPSHTFHNCISDLIS